MDARGRQRPPGLRLDGGSLALRDAREYVSEPIVPGTVQLPPGGQPIVLLADAQTHGGYPRIGHVIRADRGRLATTARGRAPAVRAVARAGPRRDAAAGAHAGEDRIGDPIENEFGPRPFVVRRIVETEG